LGAGTSDFVWFSPRFETRTYHFSDVLKFKHFILHGFSILFFAPRTEEAQSQKPHEPEVKARSQKLDQKLLCFE